ncbi:MAG: rhomboid family intramembrane serine protease [Longimicrobiales bacterium]
MFPLYDKNPTELFPYVTLVIMFACVAVWVLIQGGGFNEGILVASVCTYGAIPAEITGTGTFGGADMCTPGGHTWGALFSSMFMHGSWMHLIGNMWFLWIFGNNVEDSMGHTRFIVFYLLCGLAAGGAHVLSAAGSTIPTVGASGAIGGIMGAYFVLYPRARIVTFLYIRTFAVPAWVMLGYWFAIQLFSSQAQGPTGGGVAFWAHIGGFLAGLVTVKLFQNDQLVDAKRRGVKLRKDQIPFGGWA